MAHWAYKIIIHVSFMSCFFTIRSRKYGLMKSELAYSIIYCKFVSQLFLAIITQNTAEDARLDIIISISSEMSSPFSTLVSNNSTAEKAVFKILVSVHLSQLQLHMVGCSFTKQSLHIVACLSFVLLSISN